MKAGAEAGALSPTILTFLMETFKPSYSLHGRLVVLMLLAKLGKGSECENPSNIQCYRANQLETSYRCEWDTSGNQSDEVFDFYMNNRKLIPVTGNWISFNEEELISLYLVDIWMVDSSGCRSPRTRLMLNETVKYDAPQDISMWWRKNNLHLSWPAGENHSAEAEVRYRRRENLTGPWETKSNTTDVRPGATIKHEVIVGNLSKDSAYQVQIRHQSKKAMNPLWSKWSSVVTVPAEIEQQPVVTMTTRRTEGVREVTLTWEPIEQAAAAGGITYILEDTQSSLGCPCKKKKKEKRHHTNTTTFTTNVTFSAVNISVVAKNDVGYSLPAIIQVPAFLPTVKSCDKTRLNKKLRKGTCLELYELEEEDSGPKSVITLVSSMREEKKQKLSEVKDFVRYLYFEHLCVDGRPRTAHMCLYRKIAVPKSEPQDFVALSQTQTSLTLLWKKIHPKYQGGLLTNFSLCWVEVNPAEQQGECRNTSGALTNYRLENLKAGKTYNVSLAMTTQKGDGPRARLTQKTLSAQHPFKVFAGPLSLLLIISIGLMGRYFFLRMKNMILPAVPTPVILDFTPVKTGLQEMLENEEEVVHELILLHPDPERRGAGTEAERERSETSESFGEASLEPGSGGQEMSEMELVDKELASLLDRKGLVFHQETDMS